MKIIILDIDECANVTCQNGGVCNDYINRFECKCLLGFNGTFCENCKYMSHSLNKNIQLKSI